MGLSGIIMFSLLLIFFLAANDHPIFALLVIPAAIFVAAIYMLSIGITPKNFKSTISGEPVLDPKIFELQIANLFRVNGYKVHQTPYQGDHGIDLKAWKSDEFAVIQCKRYTGVVGEPIVRDFYGSMIHERADVGFIVTTSHYSQNAYEWAKGKRIVLIDGENLRKLLAEAEQLREVQ